MVFCSLFHIVCIVSAFFILLNVTTYCFITWIKINTEFDSKMDEARKGQRKGQREREEREMEWGANYNWCENIKLWGDITVFKKNIGWFGYILLM